MIIFLAGLRQVPQDLYEAASMDGASGWRQFRKITLPLLAPVIFFNLVFQTIEAFKAFTQAYIISGGNGGPVDSTMFYSLYLYIEAFANFRMGYASALAWLLLVIIGDLHRHRLRHARNTGSITRTSRDEGAAARLRSQILRHIMLAVRRGAA